MEKLLSEDVWGLRLVFVMLLSSRASSSSIVTSRRGWLQAGLSALILAPLAALRAAVPEGWKVYKGNFFSIGVPPGFEVFPEGDPGGAGKYDEVGLWNEALQVKFSVYSPQWNGEASMMQVLRYETLKSREEKTTGGVKEIQLQMADEEHGYIRFVVCRIKLNENTNTTFGIQIPNMKVYEKVKPTYVKWKTTLEQFAD